MAGPVPGYCVTRAVDHREGGRCFGGVALVTQWHVAALSQPAHAIVTRLEDRAAVLGGDDGIGPGIEAARRYRCRRGHVVHLATGLRGSDAVDDDRVRQ